MKCPDCRGKGGVILDHPRPNKTLRTWKVCDRCRGTGRI